MATTQIQTVKYKYMGTGRMKLSEQEKVFSDCLLKGMTNLDSVFEAGFYPKDKKDDPVIRQRASVKATSLLKKICVREYINKNRKTIYLSTEGCDRRALKVHIYEIAMGNVTQKVFDKDGEEIQVPPSFKDQIAAAALFNKMDNEDRLARVNSIDVMPESVTEEIDAKVTKFISKFNNREIAEDASVDARLRHHGIIEPDFVDVSNAVDNFLEEETKID